MDSHHIDLVQSTFASVVPISDLASRIFYDELFALEPDLRALFADDLTEQRRKLMMMLGAAVNGIGDWESTAPVVRELGSRHVGYGVQPAHFGAVGAALLTTLEKGLGDAFTPAVREAWTECYVLISSEMKDAMLAAGTPEVASV
ncbi:globin family protein [Microbacterium panaciterrae]|uniref:Globin family protein n=1 Tax=Microbacterium panaciterrae TaxID=985759 RepID=A0ABP8P3R1_9MICO